MPLDFAPRVMFPPDFELGVCESLVQQTSSRVSWIKQRRIDSVLGAHPLTMSSRYATCIWKTQMPTAPMSTMRMREGPTSASRGWAYARLALGVAMAVQAQVPTPFGRHGLGVAELACWPRGCW